MFKLVMTMKRRAGMSFEQFMDYYHDHHLPNVFSILPVMENGALVHRRNFIRRDDPFHAVIGDGRSDSAPPFDVISEIEFATRDDAETAMRLFFDARYLGRIKEDEERFIDQATNKFYVVEVHETKLR